MNPIFLTAPKLIDDDTAWLEGAEARHAKTVLRLKAQAPLTVVDGIGNGYRCEILKVGRDKIECRIVSRIRHYGEPHSRVTVVAGLSTGYKFDEIIQKGTELGASRFIPLLTDKSKIKIEDPKRWKNKIGRWRKVAIASMKQSRRSLIPEIEMPATVSELIKGKDAESLLLLLDPNHGSTYFDKINYHNDISEYFLITGPESGFSLDEIEQFQTAGAKTISVGKRILRTENASPAALAILMFLLGELR